MAKIRYSAIVIFLIGVLVMSSVPQPARADNGSVDIDRPIRLHATAMRAPIGSVDAFGSININGKQVSGEQSLWGGELIEASSASTTRVYFDSIGTAALTKGTAVRFATTRSIVAEQGGPVLVASVAKGDVAIHLHQHAGAYIEAAGRRFTALHGASFRIGIHDGLAILATVSGTVNSEPQAQPSYKIKPVDDLGRPVDLGRTLSVRARSTRNFNIQVTDENDKPIPDLPILFSLGNPCLGTLGLGAAGGSLVRKNTDNKGIAAVPFVAGAAKCIGSLSAKVEGTNTEFTQQVGVQGSGGFWTARNSLLMAGIAAGAVVGAALIVGAGDDSEPLRPVPPPNVRP
jgi:hypothetical protein